MNKKIKVILINPPFLLEERYGDLKKFGAATEPLGLAYLAANLEKYGYQVSIIDSPVLGFDIKKTVQVVYQEKADLIGITVLTTMYVISKKLAQAIKEQIPQVKIVMGGAHPTALPRETLKDIKEIDFVCVGEGEHTMVLLVEALSNHKSLSVIDGLAFRDKQGQIIVNQPRKPQADLDSLPVPARHLLPMNRYRLTISRIKTQSFCPTLIIARGCPYNCLFCSHTFGQTFRPHSIKRILSELDELITKYKINQVNFEADTLTINRNYILNLCQAMIDSGLSKKLGWTCTSRVDTVDEEVLRAMKTAGCWEISYGIESGVQRLLDSINKLITIKQIERIISLTKKIGISVRGFFMIGLPSETIAESWQTINFAKKLNPLWAQFTITIPYPGTPMYNQLNNAGKIKNYNWDNYNTWGGWVDKELPFIEEGRSQQELKQLQKQALINFYLRPKAILNLIRHIDSFKTFKKYISGFIVLLKHKIS